MQLRTGGRSNRDSGGQQWSRRWLAAPEEKRKRRASDFFLEKSVEFFEKRAVDKLETKVISERQILYITIF